VIVTGGATRSKIWMEILSNILGEKLYLSEQTDGCCFGAYSVARKGELGKFTNFEFNGRIVEPNEEAVKKYVKKFDLYNKNL
jgi:sugar (pentulose or hexulose) kinase